MLIIKY